MALQKVHPDYIDGSGASTNQALIFDGANVVWGNVSVNTAGFVTNTQLSANLADYVTNTNFVSNLVNYQTVAGLAGNVALLTANNANNLGGITSTVYVTSNGTWTITGVYTHTANLGVAGVIANGSIGLAGQALLSNGSSTYWGSAGVNADAQYTWANAATFNGNVTFSNAVSANGSTGTAGQVLASNGSSVYWTNTVSNVNTGSGLTGGPITTSGTIDVLANTGIVANSTGLFVNVAYISTLTVANAQSLGGISANAYVRSVNGISPDSVGNVPVSLTEVKTGNVANLPAQPANNGLVYVVSGDANSANDGKAYISNGSVWAEISGPDLATNDARYINVSGDTMVGTLGVVGVSANGSLGAAGQVLASNGSAAYWVTAAAGSVTNVASGSGLTGGPISTTGTLSVLANTGIIANSTGVFTDSTYVVSPTDLSSNLANYTNTSLSAANLATAYTNAVSVANTNATTLAGNAYANAISDANTNAVNLAANAYSNAIAYSGNAALAYANAVSVANTNAVALAGNAYSNAIAYSGNAALAYANAIAAIATSTANNANYFGGLAANGGSAGQVLTSNGTSAPYWSTLAAAVGANVDASYSWTNTHSFSNTVTISALSANGGVGTAGQVLTSNGTTTYWAAAGGTGTVTNVASGSGLTGGPITSTGTLSILANTGIIANSTGVFVDNTAFAALSGAVFTGNVTLAGVIANGSIGSAGQVLSSNGSATYWTTLSAAVGANVDASYSWTNTHSFSNTVTLNAINANGSLGTAGQVLASNGSDSYWTTPITYLLANTANTITAPYTFQANLTANGIIANGSVGTAGQVLTSNGSSTYWATASGTGLTFTNAASAPASPKLGDEWYDTTNDILYIRVNDGTANLWLDVTTIPSTFSNLFVTGALSANGGVGTAGQVLTSNGSVSYWSTVSTVAGANTQLYFNDSGVTNAISAFTVNKTTSNMYVANSIGINVATPLSKVDVSGTAVHNIVPMPANDMDLSQGQVFSKTIAAATTITFSNVPAGRVMTVVLHLTNGGAGAITWPAAVKWPGGTAPTLTAAGVDLIVFNTPDGGTTWRGNIFGKDIK